jgi:hypothetical protein
MGRRENTAAIWIVIQAKKDFLYSEETSLVCLEKRASGDHREQGRI